MTTNLLVMLPVLFLAGCSSSGDRSAAPPPAPAVRDSLPPPPPGPGTPPAPPAAVAENLTMVAGVVVRVEDVDSLRFVLHLEIRTAIPASPSAASLVEPGQQLQVMPLYTPGPDGRVDPAEPQNRRLRALRTVPPGDPVIGRVQLGRDGVWYLVDSMIN